MMKLDCGGEGRILEMVHRDLATINVNVSFMATFQILLWKYTLKSLPGYSLVPINNEKKRVNTTRKRTISWIYITLCAHQDC